MTCTMRRLLTIGLATLAALAAWFLLTEPAGIDLVARTGPSATMRVGPVAVAATAAVVGFAAWGLLAFLERVAGPRARRIWIIIASVLLALSLLGPLGGVATSAVIGLLTLHLVVGVVLITGLPRPA